MSTKNSIVCTNDIIDDGGMIHAYTDTELEPGIVLIEFEGPDVEVFNNARPFEYLTSFGRISIPEGLWMSFVTEILKKYQDKIKIPKKQAMEIKPENLAPTLNKDLENIFNKEVKFPE